MVVMRSGDAGVKAVQMVYAMGALLITGAQRMSRSLLLPLMVLCTWGSISLLMAGDAVDRFIDDAANEEKIARGDLLSTDDNLYLEYATPKNNVSGMPSIDQTIGMLARYRSFGR